MIYLEVAVAAAIDHSLTYSAPRDDDACLRPGTRLLVPLKNRLITGYLLTTIRAAVEDMEFSVRPITDILDPEPLFPESMVPFFRWIAKYYHHPIGEVIKTALPADLTARSGRRILLTGKGGKELPALVRNIKNAPSWVFTLLESGNLSPAEVRKIRRGKERGLLRKWEAEKFIDIKQELTGKITAGRVEDYVELNYPSAETPPLAKLKVSERKTLAALSRLAAASDRTAIPVKILSREYSGCRKALEGLKQKELICLSKKPLYRDPFGDPPLIFPEPESLTAEQTAALAALRPAIKAGNFQPFLLHGVTGSGKTEIYLRAAQTALDAGRGVIVMVPEIALAAQLEHYFFSRFGARVALLHSGLSARERLDQWLRIVRGEARIVIGARSALFSPLADPGLIVVDEEHDGAYKQEDGLRYQARDLAVLRANLQNAAVILGSATPSVVSYHHALNGKYRLLRLTRRVEGRPLPEVQIVDLKHIKTASGRPPIFSSPLISAIGENLSENNQTLLLLNRRGFANLLVCLACGQPVTCRHCNVTLTLHQERGVLLCHYCGFSINSRTICNRCHSGNLAEIGYGTEKIVSELIKIFPAARIGRLDRDTALNRKAYQAILKKVHQGAIDILVGTQMIAKGHHFPNVTLVGVIWADAGLGIPDFRAGERTFQLLSQVTGRAGRGDKPGRVIIQTSQPEHYSIKLARDHDYPAMFDRERTLRSSLNYPPFSRLINLCCEGEREETVESSARLLAQRAQSLNSDRRLSILGPAPAPLSRLRGKYRWQLLLKGQDVEALHVFCKRLLGSRPPVFNSQKVKLAVDVDPEAML